MRRVYDWAIGLSRWQMRLLAILQTTLFLILFRSPDLIRGPDWLDADESLEELDPGSGAGDRNGLIVQLPIFRGSALPHTSA